MQVAHGLDHGQRAAGERAVGAAHHAALGRDLGPAQHVAPVAHARRGHRVGDQGEAPAGRLPGDEHGLAGEVVAVDDDLHGHVGARERGHGDPRIAGDARAHRVEQVGDRARAAIEGQVRLGGGRVGVPAGHGDPAPDQLVDELEGAVQLGRERHLAHRAGLEQPPQQGEVGRAAALGVMRAEPLRRQERALEVRADDPRAAALDGHRAPARRRGRPPAR